MNEQKQIMDLNQMMNQNQMMDPKDKRMKELEEKINKLNIQLKEEQNKNFNLLKQNKNLQNIINNLKIHINNQNNNLMPQNNNNEMIKLYKKIEDLNEKLKRYPYILEKDEKIMSVIFTSVDQKHIIH